MNTCQKCNNKQTGNFHQTGCNSCGYKPSTPSCADKGCPTPCKGESIDTYLLSKKWGNQDECNGSISKRYIPGFLIDYCPDNNISKGYKDPCNPEYYYKVIDGMLYRISYECDGRIATQTFIKDARINDCAIRSLDGEKITNVCGMLRNSGVYTDINDPTKDYIIDSGGETSVNPNIILLDNVITNGCKVKTVLDPESIRRSIYPDLACLGVTYNSVNGTVFVNTSVLVDGEILVSETPSNGGCRKIRFRYIDSDTIDFSQSSTSGFTGEVKFQDTNSVNISKDANGLKADIIFQDSPTIDLSVDASGLRADILKCPGLNAEYLDYSGQVVTLSANHREAGSNTLFPDEGALQTASGVQDGSPTPFLTNRVSFAFSTPALPAGCDPDFYWLYEVNGRFNTDINVTDNARVTLSSQMIFNNSDIGSKTGDAIVIRDYTELAGSSANFNSFYARDRADIGSTHLVPPRTSPNAIDGYADSQGTASTSNFWIAVRPGVNISGDFVQMVGFPNNTIYSNISLPIIGANVPFSRWFGWDYVTLLRQGKIKKSTLPL